MTDVGATIAAKSDQLNSDDLLAGPITIRVTAVKQGTSAEQPIDIYYDGAKFPWKPCKTMRRVLVAFWGPKGDAYVGRSITLMRDPTVKWGGIEVGGIRISHMSDIADGASLAVTVKRGQKAPYVVQKLATNAKAQEAPKPTLPSATDSDLAAVLTSLRATPADKRDEFLSDQRGKRAWTKEQGAAIKKVVEELKAGEKVTK